MHPLNRLIKSATGYKLLLVPAVILAAALAACGHHDSPPPGTAFRAYDFTGTPRPYTVYAAKVAEGAHCYLYLQQGQSVPAGTLQAIVDEFDNNIYPKDTATFGPEPDLDNDPRIYILLLDIKDGFDIATKQTYIAGYFDPGNEYARTANPDSNEKEMIYLDINPAIPGSPRFFSTLAHEFQHMIHWEQKDHLRKVNDDTWLNEGMSEIARLYCGYGPNYDRVYTFQNAPSDSLIVWDGSISDYGVAYMWAHYFRDRFSGRSPNIFWSMLHNSGTGIDSVNQALGDPSAFSNTFRDWAVAVYSGNTITWPGHAEWSYTSLDSSGTGNHNGVPLPGLFPPAKVNPASLAPLGVWSVDYYEYTPLSQASGTLTWTASNGLYETAALADPSPAIEPDLVSGQAYPFSAAGYLIVSTTSGTSPGDTVNVSKLLNASTGATPKAMLDQADADPVQKTLVLKTGEPRELCVNSWFSGREKALKAGGASPGF